MNKMFRITVASDIDYGTLIAEIYFDNEFIALVSQDEGKRQFNLELPMRDSLTVVPLDEFVDAVSKAKKQLTSK